MNHLSESDSHHHRAYLEQQHSLIPDKNTLNEEFGTIFQCNSVKVIPNS